MDGSLQHRYTCEQSENAILKYYEGRLHLYGKGGLPKDEKNAIQWFQKAAAYDPETIKNYHVNTQFCDIQYFIGMHFFSFFSFFFRIYRFLNFA